MIELRLQQVPLYKFFAWRHDSTLYSNWFPCKLQNDACLRNCDFVSMCSQLFLVHSQSNGTVFSGKLHAAAFLHICDSVDLFRVTHPSLHDCYRFPKKKLISATLLIVPLKSSTSRWYLSCINMYGWRSNSQVTSSRHHRRRRYLRGCLSKY
jgi:hypothetical protein